MSCRVAELPMLLTTTLYVTISIILTGLLLCCEVNNWQTDRHAVRLLASENPWERYTTEYGQSQPKLSKRRRANKGESVQTKSVCRNSNGSGNEVRLASSNSTYREGDSSEYMEELKQLLGQYSIPSELAEDLKNPSDQQELTLFLAGLPHKLAFSILSTMQRCEILSRDASAQARTELWARLSDNTFIEKTRNLEGKDWATGCLI